MILNFFFRVIKSGVHRIWENEVKPEILICDGAKAIQNGFRNVFGEIVLVLMCWFHMKKAIRENISSLVFGEIF